MNIIIEKIIACKREFKKPIRNRPVAAKKFSARKIIKTSLPYQFKKLMTQKVRISSTNWLLDQWETYKYEKNYMNKQSFSKSGVKQNR